MSGSGTAASASGQGAPSRGEVVSVNISEAKGTGKQPVPQIDVDQAGVVSDAHAGPWHRQVSMLSLERISAFSEKVSRPIGPGEFAENITVRGLDLDAASLLDRFRMGDVELELTQIGKACHGDACAIFREVGKCLMPSEGVFCRVIRGGNLKPGQVVEHLPKALRIWTLTLSDRGFAGHYRDRSGPRAGELLEAFFADKRWHWQVESTLLPDDSDRLRQMLVKAVDDGVDLVFTLGSTGVGPRDIAPETVAAVCDKTIPGIMENIRIKFGSQKPSALLSRSLAAVAGTTQIYALPGSVRAVEEYMGEILKTVEHTLLMLHGVDAH